MQGIPGSNPGWAPLFVLDTVFKQGASLFCESDKGYAREDPGRVRVVDIHKIKQRGTVERAKEK